VFARVCWVGTKGALSVFQTQKKPLDFFLAKYSFARAPEARNSSDTRVYLGAKLVPTLENGGSRAKLTVPTMQIVRALWIPVNLAKQREIRGPAAVARSGQLAFKVRGAPAHARNRRLVSHSVRRRPLGQTRPPRGATGPDETFIALRIA